MKTFTRTLLICLMGCPSAFPALSGSAEIHWRQFTGTIKDAKRVVIHVGTPRRLAANPKPSLPTAEIGDFEFFREPHKATPELAARLTRVVLDSNSFSDYRGMKFCGGFHPDVCIEWQFEQNGQRWHKRAFVCLGCDEWRLVDTISAVHTDMTKQAADELTGIVRELRGAYTQQN
jgi:hypothetical protein